MSDHLLTRVSQHPGELDPNYCQYLTTWKGDVTVNYVFPLNCLFYLYLLKKMQKSL